MVAVSLARNALFYTNVQPKVTKKNNLQKYLLPFVVEVSMLGCNRAKPIGVHHNLVCAMIQLSWKELPGKQPAATLTVYKVHVQKYNQLCIKVLYGHISHSWTWPTKLIMLLEIIAKIQDWHIAKHAICLSFYFLFSLVSLAQQWLKLFQCEKVPYTNGYSPHSISQTAQLSFYFSL